LASVVLQVCGVEALKQFSSNLLIPYKSTSAKNVPEGKVDELEQRVSTLRLQLKEVESELDRLRKGKQKND
jgi:chaperonin cofactor prefoldin